MIEEQVKWIREKIAQREATVKNIENDLTKIVNKFYQYPDLSEDEKAILKNFGNYINKYGI